MAPRASRGQRNEYRVEGDVVYLALTQGKEAVINADDLELVLPYAWHAVKTSTGDRFYAHSSAGYLHRFIVGAKPGLHVDHINGDGLDNRKSNLRFATNQQNAQNKTRLDPRNKSGTRGVSVHTGSDGKKYWIAKISITRYFPYTDDGYQQALDESIRLREILRPNDLI